AASRNDLDALPPLGESEIDGPDFLALVPCLRSARRLILIIYRSPARRVARPTATAAAADILLITSSGTARRPVSILRKGSSSSTAIPNRSASDSRRFTS